MYPLSKEEKELWRKQNIADLLYWADLPFDTKLKMIEGMEEVIRSMHQGKLPKSPNEREELVWD